MNIAATKAVEVQAAATQGAREFAEAVANLRYEVERLALVVKHLALAVDL